MPSIFHLLPWLRPRRDASAAALPPRTITIVGSQPTESGCTIGADGWVRGTDGATLGGLWGAMNEEAQAPALRIALHAPLPPAPTTVIAVAGNLQVDSAQPPPEAQAEIFDRRGGRHLLRVAFAAADASLGGAPSWSIEPSAHRACGPSFDMHLSSEAWARPAALRLCFGANGQVLLPAERPLARLKLRLGGEEQLIDLDVGAGLCSGPGRLTARPGPAYLGAIRCDGNPAGLPLEACEETPAGFLVGHYSGGRARVLGRLRRTEQLGPSGQMGQPAPPRPLGQQGVLSPTAP